MSEATPVPPQPTVEDLQVIIKSLQLTVTQLQMESAQNEIAAFQAHNLYMNERAPKLQAIIAQSQAVLKAAASKE